MRYMFWASEDQFNEIERAFIPEYGTPEGDRWYFEFSRVEHGVYELKTSRDGIIPKLQTILNHGGVLLSVEEVKARI